MSTLALADLDPKMQRALGLDPRCGRACNGRSSLAILPVVEITAPSERITPKPGLPGAEWLKNGLHRLRVPRQPGRSSTVSARS